MTHHILPVALTLGLAALLSSCSNFLEEFSQDNVIPTSTKDYSEILYGDAYFKDVALPYKYVELMTDDVEAQANDKAKQGEDQRRTAYGYFTWQANPELSPTNVLNSDQSWLTLYSHILTANVILNDLKEMSGSEAEKDQLEGEAYAVKLHSYFTLTNLYGEPYDPATAATAVGVPINNHHYSEDVNFPRATVAEDYAEMIKAIDGAMAAFAKVDQPKNIFRWNAAAVAVLASRVYLYMQDWDRTIRYATDALQRNPALYDLNTLGTPGETDSKRFLTRENREINYSYGFYRIPELSTVHPFYYSASKDLLSIYGEGDLRYYADKGFFINTNRMNVGSLFFPKWVTTIDVVKSDLAETTRVYGFSIRSAEAYLNRAEAYAEKGELAKAMADINTLRKARVTPEHALLEQPATQEETLQLVREERRRELCFELHRWFDLRRQGMPELKHTYIAGNGEELTTEEYTLPARSPKYVLPIPHNVLNSDAVLGQGSTTTKD